MTSSAAAPKENACENACNVDDMETGNNRRAIARSAAYPNGPWML